MRDSVILKELEDCCAEVEDPVLLMILRTSYSTSQSAQIAVGLMDRVKNRKLAPLLILVADIDCMPKENHSNSATAG